MKISLSIQTPDIESPLPLTLLSGTFEEKCKRAAEYGADGVEIVTTNPASLNHSEIRKCLEKYHLFPAAISSGGIAKTLGLTLLNPDSSIAKSAYQRLEDLVLFAGGLGSPIVTIGSFRGRANEKSEIAQTQLAEILYRGGDFAQENNTHLAIEPLNRYETDIIFNTRQGLDFLHLVDHPSIGLLIDTFHANIEESSWTEPFRQGFEAKKLFHIHIADNNRLTPGAGLIDFTEILSLLHQINYKGFISAELLAKPDPDTAAQLTLTFLHNILGQL